VGRRLRVKSAKMENCLQDLDLVVRFLGDGRGLERGREEVDEMERV